MKTSFSLIGCNTAKECNATPADLFLGSDRSALLIIMLFVFAVLSVPKFNLQEVIVFAAFPIFLVSAARLPFSRIAKPLLRISPFALLMATGNLFLDHNPVLQLSGITVTGGVMSGTVIIAKTLITVSGMLSLTLCIPFQRICRALEAFHLPEAVITQLILLNRFSSVLQEEALAMQRARDIRSFGNRGRGIVHTASLIGALLLRTTNRAERVYRAMSARGFNGALLSHSPEKTTAAEWATVGLWGALFLSLRLVF